MGRSGGAAGAGGGIVIPPCGGRCSVVISQEHDVGYIYDIVVVLYCGYEL